MLTARKRHSLPPEQLAHINQYATQYFRYNSRGPERKDLVSRVSNEMMSLYGAYWTPRAVHTYWKNNKAKFKLEVSRVDSPTDSIVIRPEKVEEPKENRPMKVGEIAPRVDTEYVDLEKMYSDLNDATLSADIRKKNAAEFFAKIPQITCQNINNTTPQKRCENMRRLAEEVDKATASMRSMGVQIITQMSDQSRKNLFSRCPPTDPGAESRVYEMIPRIIEEHSEAQKHDIVDFLFSPSGDLVYLYLSSFTHFPFKVSLKFDCSDYDFACLVTTVGTMAFNPKGDQLLVPINTSIYVFTFEEKKVQLKLVIETGLLAEECSNATIWKDKYCIACKSKIYIYHIQQNGEDPKVDTIDCPELEPINHLRSTYKEKCPENSHLVAASTEHVYPIAFNDKYEPVAYLVGHIGGILSMTSSASNDIATGSRLGSIRLWDIQRNFTYKKLFDQNISITNLAIYNAANQKTYLLASNNHKIQQVILWRVEDCTSLRSWDIRSDHYVIALGFCPNKNQILIAYSNRPKDIFKRTFFQTVIIKCITLKRESDPHNVSHDFSCLNDVTIASAIFNKAKT